MKETLDPPHKIPRARHLQTPGSSRIFQGIPSWPTSISMHRLLSGQPNPIGHIWASSLMGKWLPTSKSRPSQPVAPELTIERSRYAGQSCQVDASMGWIETRGLSASPKVQQARCNVKCQPIDKETSCGARRSPLVVSRGKLTCAWRGLKNRLSRQLDQKDPLN